MELLRVAAEQNEATISRESQHTPSANPNSNADADSDSISNKMPLPPPPPPPTEYVSKFRIDGQPILPPLVSRALYKRYCGRAITQAYQSR